MHCCRATYVSGTYNVVDVEVFITGNKRRQIIHTAVTLISFAASLSLSLSLSVCPYISIFTARRYVRDMPSCVCLSVCHKPVFY